MLDNCKTCFCMPSRPFIIIILLLCKPHAEHTTQIIIQMSAITNSVLVYLKIHLNRLRYLKCKTDLLRCAGSAFTVIQVDRYSYTMNTDRTTTRDWLGTQNEVQFFIHSSSAEPLSVIGVKNTSQCTIQVRAKPLRDIKVSYTYDCK